MTSFKGWKAFSVYAIEGEEGTIHLSANGLRASCGIGTPMGRALSQLAAIQAEAARPTGDSDEIPGKPHETGELEEHKALSPLVEILRVIKAMDDEYSRDEECDYVKINGFIEELSELRDVALSPLVDEENGPSNASRARMGPVAHPETEAEPSGPRSYGASVNGGE